MMYVQKIYAIVGYTNKADNICPDCMSKIALAEVVKLNRGHFGRDTILASTEALLNRWADHLGIERENEATFDSGEFPKVVFASMIEPNERCGKCGEEL